MENQEINLEKVHRIIEELQSQAAAGDIQNMLPTAQSLVVCLQSERSAAAHKQPTRQSGCVSVVMPFSTPALKNSESIYEATAESVVENMAPRPSTEISAESSIEKVINEPVKEIYTLQEETLQETPQYKVPKPPENTPKVSELNAEDEVGTELSVEVNTSLNQSIPHSSLQEKLEDEFKEQIPAPNEIESQEVAPEKTNNRVNQDDLEAQKRKHLAFIEDNFAAWVSYGVDTEAPTLVQNESLVESSVSTSTKSTIQTQAYKDLNDQLGDQHMEEWAQKMQTTPIENLSSAIGINDRYLYISELFRGDESMYERSIITLNKFNNFHEAHAWTQRELSLKLGWDANSAITQQFEQLIKRRFSG